MAVDLVDRVRELTEQGLTGEKTAEVLHCSVSTVWKIRRKIYGFRKDRTYYLRDPKSRVHVITTQKVVQDSELPKGATRSDGCIVWLNTTLPKWAEHNKVSVNAIRFVLKGRYARTKDGWTRACIDVN